MCPQVAGALAACSAGACAYICAPDFADCDGDLTNATTDGCEADLRTDSNDCGACGNVCAASGTPHSAGTCASGQCSDGCQVGFADCDHSADDGCEVELASDPKNCGECGAQCSSTCTNGLCDGQTPLCQLYATDASQAVDVALATDGQTFALAWIDFDNAALWLAHLDATGHALGDVQVTAAEGSDRFDLIYDGTSYVLAWAPNTPSSAVGTVVAQRYSPESLQPVGPRVQFVASSGSYVYALRMAASATGDVLFAAIDGSELASHADIAVWPASATQISAPHSPSLPNLTELAGVAAVADGYVVAWVSTSAGLQGPFTLSARHLGPDGTAGPIQTLATTEAEAPGPIPFSTVLHATPTGAMLGTDFSNSGGPPAAQTLVLQSDATAAGNWNALVADPIIHALSMGFGGAPDSLWLTTLLGTNGDQLTAHAVSASGGLVGNPITLAVVPSVETMRIASNAGGTLFAWNRLVQTNTSAHPIDAVYLPKQGVPAPPCP